MNVHENAHKADDNEATTEQLEHGARVFDRDSPDEHPNWATVVAVAELRADDVPIPSLDGKPTVAQFNPDYPPSDRVIAVAFERGGKRYFYPESRLRRATPEETGEPREVTASE